MLCVFGRFLLYSSENKGLSGSKSDQSDEWEHNHHHGNIKYAKNIVRVNKNFAAAMHIDTDESNAACASGIVYGEIIK